MTDDKPLRDAIREISRVLAATDDSELINSFLSSILTKAEIKEIAGRWILVREIDAGMTQREIARKYSLSLCKITRGSRELKKPESSFKKMIDKLKNLS
jgi:TrpR family trp operon transcriptional repressor